MLTLLSLIPILYFMFQIVFIFFVSEIMTRGNYLLF